jgi:hypothetical protein
VGGASLSNPSSTGSFQVLGHPAKDVNRGQVFLLGHPTDQQLPRRLDPLQQPGMGPAPRRGQLQPVAFPLPDPSPAHQLVDHPSIRPRVLDQERLQGFGELSLGGGPLVQGVERLPLPAGDASPARVRSKCCSISPSRRFSQ